MDPTPANLIEERRKALRLLLGRPLVRVQDEPDLFPLLVRHRPFLVQWFSDQLGWRLLIDPAAGFARLFKVPHQVDGTRGIQVRTREPFNAQRYTLLCLILTVLDGGQSLVNLGKLATQLKEQSQGEPGIAPFDPDLITDRRAFVDVLRWLEWIGVLENRDGEAEAYINNPTGDVLYGIEDRILRQLLSAPLPPTLAGDQKRMMTEVYPESDEGQRQRARHKVFRALLDDPVVYDEDLSPSEQDWLRHALGFVRTQMDLLGLLLEQRLEGLLAVDPEGTLSDTLFPDGGSTVKHAALLICAQFTQQRLQAPLGTISDEEVHELATNLMNEYGERCGWSAIYRTGPGGADRLAKDALWFLAGFNLVRRVEDGWQPRPVIARFAPGPVTPGKAGHK